jgi:glucose-1-phosphate thymidylyltransferase
VYTNQRILEIKKHKIATPIQLNNVNSLVIEPCFIGKNVTLEHSIIGPHVSIGANCIIKNSNIENSMIQNSTKINNKIIQNAMIGSSVEINGNVENLSVGDYTTIR